MDSKQRRSKKQVKYDEFPDFGKLPPQAVEEEEAVLGALMIESEAYSRISDILHTHECFYNVNHQKIFSAIKAIAEANKPIDMLTVKEQLLKDNTLEDIGGVYAIAALTEKIATAAHIEEHANTIYQRYLARKMIRISSEIQTDAFDLSKDIDEVIQEAEGKIFELAHTKNNKDVLPISEVIPKAIESISKVYQNKNDIPGIESGFFALDKLTSGWQESDLIIIAARPAMGKTAFVLTMAKNMAAKGYPIAFFTLEMSSVQLAIRLISNLSELPNERIKSGKLDKEEFNELMEGIAVIDNLPIYIDETPSLSVMELRTKARRLVAEHGIKAIIIDYLQLMNVSGMSYSNRENEVSIISRSLKALAKELSIPVIALSQLNRNVESRGGGSMDNKLEAKKPQLSDLRESGAIEQDADMVCFIHRPEYYRIFEDPNTNEDLRGVAQIIVAKHRNGATADIKLYFAQDYITFVNTRQEYERLNAKSASKGSVLLPSKANKSTTARDVGLDIGNELLQDFDIRSDLPY